MVRIRFGLDATSVRSDSGDPQCSPYETMTHRLLVACATGSELKATQPDYGVENALIPVAYPNAGPDIVLAVAEMFRTR